MAATVAAPVINATGRVLDDALGGTPWAAAARTAATGAAGYTDLRHDPAEALATRAAALLGAADALVVASLPAAAMLTFAALPTQAVVARPDLVTIRGSRLPQLAEAVGHPLLEVGATDLVTLTDWDEALTEATAAVTVHPASTAVQPTWQQVTELAHDVGADHVHVVRSGALLDHPLDEATTTASGLLEAGADLVVAPTDRLGGGPALALIAGTTALVGALRRHPLAATVVPDRTLLAALDATLDLHQQASPPRGLPVWAMLGASEAMLHQRAHAIAEAIGHSAEALPCTSRVRLTGPSVLTLSSWGVLVPAADPDLLETRLRGGSPTVVALQDEAGALLDLRTVAPTSDDDLVRAVQAALAG